MLFSAHDAVWNNRHYLQNYFVG